MHGSGGCRVQEQGITHLGSGESRCPDGRLLAFSGALLCWQGQTNRFLYLFHDSPTPEGPLTHKRLPKALPLNTKLLVLWFSTFLRLGPINTVLRVVVTSPTIKPLCCYITIVILLLCGS